MHTNRNIEEQSHLIAKLTDLEYKVLAALIHGESINSIADLLSITPAAALETRGALLEKFAAKSTADLVRIGLKARVRWP